MHSVVTFLACYAQEAAFLQRLGVTVPRVSAVLLGSLAAPPDVLIGALLGAADVAAPFPVCVMRWRPDARCT
eukprot:4992970-Lingulodinium_polyedra.AAC.1